MTSPFDVSSSLLGSIGAELNGWSNLDPHFILFAFLPPLIFESAVSVDYHIFKHSISQMIVLAVPGVLLSTILIGYFVLFAFLLFWCVVCYRPVCVVARRTCVWRCSIAPCSLRAQLCAVLQCSFCSVCATGKCCGGVRTMRHRCWAAKSVLPGTRPALPTACSFFK